MASASDNVAPTNVENIEMEDINLLRADNNEPGGPAVENAAENDGPAEGPTPKSKEAKIDDLKKELQMVKTFVRADAMRCLFLS